MNEYRGVIGRRQFFYTGLAALTLAALPAESQDKKPAIKKRVTLEDAQKGKVSKKLEYLAQLFEEEKMFFDAEKNPEGVIAQKDWLYLGHEPHRVEITQRLKSEAKGKAEDSEKFAASIVKMLPEYVLTARTKDAVGKPEAVNPYIIVAETALNTGNEDDLRSRMDYAKFSIQCIREGIVVNGEKLNLAQNLELYYDRYRFLNLRAAAKQQKNIIDGTRKVSTGFAVDVQRKYLDWYAGRMGQIEKLDASLKNKPSSLMEDQRRLILAYLDEVAAIGRSAGYDTKLVNGSWTVEKIAK
jgi:hypothetical protein